MLRTAPNEHTSPSAVHDDADRDSERLLPHNIEAERGVLDSLLIDPAPMPAVAQLLVPSDFWVHEYRAIFAALLAMHERGEPPDPVLLYDELLRSGKLELAGDKLSGLGYSVPTSLNALRYARIVRRESRKRALIDAATKIASAAQYAPDDDAACDFAMREVLQVMQRGSTNAQTRTRSFAEILDELGVEVQMRMDADGPLGLPTGFGDLDKHIVGLEPGDLVYLAGRPGSGKSALGLKIALLIALHLHAKALLGTVDVITLEMSAKQQARRLVADRAEQNTRFIRAGFREYKPGKGWVHVTKDAATGSDEIDMAAWMRFDQESAWLKERIGERLYVTDGTASMGYLRALVQRAVLERGCRVVVIDQLDLFSDGANDDEFARITKMSRQLKQIARAYGVVILCMVQLSRKCEERPNKRPMLSELRQTGQLEQDADMVWGLYRPALYKPTNTDPRFQQFAELLLLKGRDTGNNQMVPLRFEKEYTRFRDWPFKEIPDDETRPKSDEASVAEVDATDEPEESSAVPTTQRTLPYRDEE